MKDGDYIVAINEEDVKWSPHDQVVGLIKRSGNALKLRLITPLDSKKDNNTHKIIQSSEQRGPSSEPTSSASSTSGHSSGSGGQSAALALSGSGYSPGPSGGELSSSPASSITSGSTRSHNHHQKHDSKKQSNLKTSTSRDPPAVNNPWNPFKKGQQSSKTHVTATHHINDNIILR